MSRQLLDRAAAGRGGRRHGAGPRLLKRHLVFEPGDNDALARYARCWIAPRRTPADRAADSGAGTAGAEGAEKRDRGTPPAGDPVAGTAGLPGRAQAHQCAVAAGAGGRGLLLLRGQCQQAAGDTAEAADVTARPSSWSPVTSMPRSCWRPCCAGRCSSRRRPRTVLDDMVPEECRPAAGLAGAGPRPWPARTSSTWPRPTSPKPASAEPGNAEVLRASA